MVAILIALAVIGRVPFAFIPGFQAASTVIILSGYTLGPDLGFVIGATTALASNMFLGQGPWTPWQMFAWGLMGVGASFFATMKSKHAYPALIVYGGLAGFIYGWIMDLWYVLVYVHPLTPKSAFLGFAASFFPFDSFHAISNVVLVAALFPFWVRFFDQLMTKYRIQLPSHKTRR